MPAKPIILAADDSATVRKLVEISLSKDEFDLHFALDGRSCVAQATKLVPDLILLDYILPDMKGQEVCQALLQAESTRDIPILLVSGNGAAIRQTYEALGNVADYLTKPFAPNVLHAVVGHLLSKQAEADATPASGTLDLPVETRTGAATVASADTPLQSEIASTLEARLAPALTAFPSLEALREDADPATYFLQFLRTSGVLAQLTDALLHLEALQPPRILLAGTAALVPADEVLKHLAGTGATGRLSLELSDEVVRVHFEAGEIVHVTSNNPKRYCQGATFNFRALPATAIAAAVARQQAAFTPFFVTLHTQGALPPQTPLAALLRSRGEATLARALNSSSVRFRAEGLATLPEEIRPWRLRYPLDAVLLAAYRAVEDWARIEAVIPHFEVVLTRDPDAPGLGKDPALHPAEMMLLERIDGKRTILDLARAGSQDAVQICRQLFPFVRLGWISPVPRPSSELPEPLNERLQPPFTVSPRQIQP